jgi:hypothetical protein
MPHICPTPSLGLNIERTIISQTLSELVVYRTVHKLASNISELTTESSNLRERNMSLGREVRDKSQLVIVCKVRWIKWRSLLL